MWPLLALGLVVVGVIIYQGFQVFSRSVVYYRTPTEVQAAPGTHVRLSGSVVPGSIIFAADRGTVYFRVTDGRTTLPVSYSGPAPDTLKDGAQAVAEGRLAPDGVFRAVSLFARCPSKFKASPGGG